MSTEGLAMRGILQTVACSAALSMWAVAATAAEVSSTPLTLDPTYDAGGCALVSFNGYGGTDRQLFIPTVDGYYTVKDYSSNNTEALITAEAFDPNQRLVDQALAGSSGAVGMPSHTYLTAGTRVLIWAVYNGGYATIAGCQADGATQTVTMRVVGEDTSVPDAPTALTATALSGGAYIYFTPGAANGSAITNYQVGTFDGLQYNYVALAPADISSPIVVTGLTNGVFVRARLKAVNANGASTDSAPVEFTPTAAAASAAVVAASARPVPTLPGYLLWLLVLSVAAVGFRWNNRGFI